MTRVTRSYMVLFTRREKNKNLIHVSVVILIKIIWIFTHQNRLLLLCKLQKVILITTDYYFRPRICKPLQYLKHEKLIHNNLTCRYCSE